jgi:hypothetical protein
MNKTPPGASACCLPAADGLTYIKVSPKNHVAGMQNLDVVFQQLYLLKRQPLEASDEELVGMARKSNYIPYKAEIEADYAVALRKAYASYYARQEKKLEKFSE